MTIILKQVNYVGTDKPTINPVSPSEPFYQEVQQYKKCWLHSINHFAGHHILNVNELFRINNEFHINDLIDNSTPRMRNVIKKEYGSELTPEIALQYIKKNTPMFLRETLKDVEDEGFGGMNTSIMMRYIEQHKTDLNLPENAHMIRAEGLLNSKEIQNTLLYIETHPIERVLFSLSGEIENRAIVHTISIRKDTSGSWRVLDSMSHSFNLQASNPLDHMQPAYKTLEEALNATMLKYNAQKNQIKLIYSSVDYTHTTIKPASSISHTQHDTAASELEITQATGLPLFISHLIDQHSTLE